MKKVKCSIHIRLRQCCIAIKWREAYVSLVRVRREVRRQQGRLNVQTFKPRTCTCCIFFIVYGSLYITRAVQCQSSRTSCHEHTTQVAKPTARDWCASRLGLEMRGGSRSGTRGGRSKVKLITDDDGGSTAYLSFPSRDKFHDSERGPT